MTTDPCKISAPGDALPPVERPTTGDASPASPVVTFRPSASPVAQMVQCQDDLSAAELHAHWLYWLRVADDFYERAADARRAHKPWAAAAASEYASAAAARAYSYAVQAERAEKAGDPLADARREVAADAMKRRGGGFQP